MPEQKTFREWRKEKGLTVKYIIQTLKSKYDISISEWQLNDREKNQNKFTPKEIQSLCRIYGKTIDEIKF